MSSTKYIKSSPNKWWLSPGVLFHKGKKAVAVPIPTFVKATEISPPTDFLVLGVKSPKILETPQVHPKNIKGNTMMSGCRKAIWLCFSEITVEPVLFLYMLSTFSLFTLFQDLVYSRACLSSYTQYECDNIKSSEDLQETVQKAASHWILMSTISLVLPSIFIAIYLGSWSDKFGPKWPIIFPPLGGVLSCIVYIALAFNTTIHVGWICLASFLSGLSGGFVSCIMSCMTYVASISSEETRTVRISRLEAMIFLGGTVGPFLSGTMVQYIGHGYAFVFMLVSYAISSLYALLFVKEVHDDGSNHDGPSNTQASISSKSTTLESRDLDLESAERLLARESNNLDNLPDIARCEVYKKFPEDKYAYPIEIGESFRSHEDCENSTAASEDERKNIWSSQNTPEPIEDVQNTSFCSMYFGSEHFSSALKTVTKEREGGRKFQIIIIVVAAYISMMVTAGELDVAYLFAKGEPLEWDHQIFSYYFGFKYGLGTLVLLVGMPLFQQFQIKDTTICILGLFSRAAGLILYAVSPNTPVAFLVPIVSIFSFFSIPATRSLLSKLVDADEQGKIFAFVAIMEDLCTLTASLVFNSLYPLTRPIFKGAIFLLASVSLIIPIIIMWFIGRRLSRLDRNSPLSISTTDSSASNASPIRDYTHSSEDADHGKV